MPDIRDRRAAWKFAAAAILGTGMGLPSSSCAGTTWSPETDVYLTHNNMFRSRIVAGANWTDTAHRWTSGLLEYSVDFGLVSFFRRYVYKDPNAEKSKFVTVRLGYAYLPDFHEDDAGADEQRAVAELTLRLPIGGQWLWSDRSKADFRWVGDDTSTRYRNRLRVERSVAFGGFKGTPYGAAEAYYDTAVDRWNRAEFRVGMEFPWRYSTVLDCYFAHQAVWENASNEIIGLVVQKHMSMPMGGKQ